MGSVTLPDEAGVAQLAEQLFCKQQVTGSIPVAGSSSRQPDWPDATKWARMALSTTWDATIWARIAERAALEC